ncbi:hypothetical protein [Sphingomonas solaris]|uniref:DUF1983 domain-containing protein n=1 Tax=Alterirhizorhabdus solaris TaxID=2529389 RepID=A0A558R7F4_9SPHN|nr:hypothetical protein [Sphingomonas solaris]TVV75307.1 hypothetical protein FOY91_07620 [Sphingomonas solaris]
MRAGGRRGNEADIPVDLGARRGANRFQPRIDQRAQLALVDDPPALLRLIGEQVELEAAAGLAVDGGQRTKEIEFPLVQDPKLAAELAAYEIVNAREFGPIVLPLKPRWIGYKPGDCLTIDVPELNMIGQTAIVMNRSLDPSTGVVTLTLRSETAAKHDFALGRTASPPPTPSLQVIDPSQLLIPGISAVWGAIADDGGKPDDNADVTGENTALDTANVAGTPASQIKAAAAQVATLTGTGPGSISYDIGTVRTALEGQIVTGKAEQKVITDSLSLQMGVRRNLVVNGGLERGLEGINLPAGQGFSKSDNPTWGPILSSNTASGTQAVAFPRFAAQAGQRHVITGDITLVATAGAAYLDILYTDAAGNLLSGGDGPEKRRTASFQFAEGSAGRDASAAESLAPTGTVWAQPRFVYEGVSGITVIGVRQVKAELGALPWTAYSVADQTLQSTFADITTVKNVVVGPDSALAQLDTRLTAAAQQAGNDALAAKGQISDLSTVVAGNNLAAGQRFQSVEASIGAERAGSPNLVRKGDGRSGFLGVGANAGGFAVTNHPTLGSIFQKAGAAANDTLFWDIPVEAGWTLSISAEMGFNPPDAGIAYVRYLGGEPYVGDPAGTFRSENWIRAGGQLFTVPAGVTALRILVAATKACDFGVSRVQLQRGAWTAYRYDADVRDITASAAITQAAVADVQGRTASYIQLQAIAGTSMAKFTVAAAGGPNPYSRMLFEADQFLFRGDVIIDGSIRTSAIVDDGITMLGNMQLGGPVDGSGATVNAVTYNFVLDYPAKLIVLGTGSHGYMGSIPSYDVILALDGVQMGTGAGSGASYAESSFAITGGAVVPAGPHSVVLRWRGDNPAIRLVAGSIVLLGAKK